METRLSAKGQIVIPKNMRDEMALQIGERFEVVGRGNEIVLRRQDSSAGKRKLTVEQATAKLRKLIKYAGPRISEEQIASAGPEMAARKYEKFLQQR